eukprot:6210497-Pleurochrysis_carterae.AAC.1
MVHRSESENDQNKRAITHYSSSIVSAGTKIIPSKMYSVANRPRNLKVFNMHCARAHRRSASTCGGARAH